MLRAERCAAKENVMLIFLIACNVLAGIAVGLAFRAKAIVLAAPIMAAFTLVVLLMNGYGILRSLIWLCACLFLGQFAFLLVTVLEIRAPRTKSEEAPHSSLSKTPEV
jgi:hypothetical protein